jgi:hypothetical protein
VQFIPNGFEALLLLLLILVTTKKTGKRKFPGQIWRVKAFVKCAVLPLNFYCAMAFGFYFYRRNISAETGIPLVIHFLWNYFQNPERETEFKW